MENPRLRDEPWKLVRLLISIPITVPVYFLYAVGYGVYHKLLDWGLVHFAFVWKHAYGTAFSFVNLLFNAIVFSFIFLELPQEIGVTKRLRRQRDKKGSRFAGALAKFLNFWDPGHV